MDMGTNVATQHGVPATDNETGLSGSTVWRCVTQSVSPAELAKKMGNTERGRKKRQAEKSLAQQLAKKMH